MRGGGPSTRLRRAAPAGGAGAGGRGVRARRQPVQPAGPIHVDPRRGAVAIPRRLLNELFAHALESQPEECCGLLTGSTPGRFERAHRCRNDMTRLHTEDPETWPRDGRSAFHMAEGDYLRVAREAEARGRRVTGVYHSHVGTGAYFSELDQQYALQQLFPFPDAEHVVVAVLEGKVREVAVFRRRTGGAPEEAGFEGRPVVAAEP